MNSAEKSEERENDQIEQNYSYLFLGRRAFKGYSEWLIRVESSTVSCWRTSPFKNKNQRLLTLTVL